MCMSEQDVTDLQAKLGGNVEPALRVIVTCINDRSFTCCSATQQILVHCKRCHCQRSDDSARRLKEHSWPRRGRQQAGAEALQHLFLPVFINETIAVKYRAQSPLAGPAAQSVLRASLPRAPHAHRLLSARQAAHQDGRCRGGAHSIVRTRGSMDVNEVAEERRVAHGDDRPSGQGAARLIIISVDRSTQIIFDALLVRAVRRPAKVAATAKRQRGTAVLSTLRNLHRRGAMRRVCRRRAMVASEQAQRVLDPEVPCPKTKACFLSSFVRWGRLARTLLLQGSLKPHHDHITTCPVVVLSPDDGV